MKMENYMNIATKISGPDYTYWQNALAGNFGPVHDSDPQPGFYRKRMGRAAGYVPVAIWEQDGKVLALVDGREADAAEIWTYACKFPILEEWYRARMIGQPWPDESAAVTESLVHRTDTNNGPVDEADVLKAQIESASAGAAEYAEIGTDETAAKAQSLRSRLLELSGQADKAREAQKKPFFEAGKAIDAKYQPLVKAAKFAADTIRDALGAHETRKAREAEKLRLAAEEVRIKAEREAVKARAEAELAGKPAPAPVPPAPTPEPAPAPAAAIRGAYGRAAAVKVVKVAKVIDQDKAYLALRTQKEMVELIAALAQRAATAGIPLEGVEVMEERRVA